MMINFIYPTAVELIDFLKKHDEKNIYKNKIRQSHFIFGAWLIPYSFEEKKRNNKIG